MAASVQPDTLEEMARRSAERGFNVPCAKDTDPSELLRAIRVWPRAAAGASLGPPG
jgi:hypothetical protein